MSKTSQRITTKTAAQAKLGAGQIRPEKDITESFLREVDEAMQQEKLLDFWRTYRVFVVGGVAGVLLLIAGWQLWQAVELRGIQNVAEDWYASETAKDEAAKLEAQRKVLAEGDDGYRAVAAFKLADAEIDPLAADKLYRLIYDDSGQQKWVRDLARLNAAVRLLGSDDAKAKGHLALLGQHNAGEPPSAATALALEQLAWLAVRENDVPTAKGYAAQLLALPGLTPDMTQRVGRILSL